MLSSGHSYRALTKGAAMPGLPSGTVTFLFSDIAGSTMRWEQHPDEMRAALARHDSLLQEGISAHGGVVLTERGEGDSFFALFARPSDALAVPETTPLPPVETLTQYEAVRLFITRAQGAKSDFAVTNENAPAVAEICVHLDGLPLAIELAAARVRLFTPQALLARLAHRLGVLTGVAHDLPERQRTLRATIDWSYDLLTAEEQTLFARLSVFVGGPTLEAIAGVCDADGTLYMWQRWSRC
jgi:class 3 adenylate cyclase